MFLRFDAGESEPGWKPAGCRLALQPGIHAAALLPEATASLVPTKPPNSAGKSIREQIKALRCSFQEQAQFSWF